MYSEKDFFTVKARKSSRIEPGTEKLLNDLSSDLSTEMLALTALVAEAYKEERAPDGTPLTWRLCSDPVKAGWITHDKTEVLLELVVYEKVPSPKNQTSAETMVALLSKPIGQLVDLNQLRHIDHVFGKPAVWSSYKLVSSKKGSAEVEFLVDFPAMKFGFKVTIRQLPLKAKLPAIVLEE